MNLNELIKLDHPIKIDDDILGMEYKDGYLMISNRVGNEQVPFFAVHELSHFIEMESRRIGLPIWGMTAKYDDYGEFTTLKHVDRECRVWAIQHVLQNELFNIPITIEELALNATYMRSVRHLIGDDKDIISYAQNKIKEELKNYSLDEIKQKYNHKVKILKKYFAKQA